MKAHGFVFARAARVLIPLTLLLVGCALQPVPYAPGTAPWDATAHVADWQEIAGIQYVPAKHYLPWEESTVHVADWQEIAGIQYVPAKHYLPWDPAPYIDDWRDIAGIKYVPPKHFLPWDPAPQIPDWRDTLSNPL